MSGALTSQISRWGPVRVYLRDWTYFKRMWRSVAVGSIIQPLMFLLGVGLGVGELVDSGPESANLLGDTPYFAFYATALLATTSMFVVAQEALWPTMDGFTWSNAHQAMISTPLNATDIVLGKTIHYAVRAIVTSGGVAAVLALFDDTRSLGLVPAVFVGMLTGLAIALPIAAWTATRTTDSSFPAILRFGIIPMFLFGGAFYPIEQLPGWLQPVAWFTPLWHGIELCRGLVLGGLGAGSAVGHAAVLFAFLGGGLAAARITFDRRLRS
jgi:lipooligosaccharide transport system permease protein